MSSSDFSWNVDKSSVVVTNVEAIAVYTNPNGDIVVRQEARYGSDEDAVVIIPRILVKVVVKAMQDEVKKAFAPD